LGTERQSRPRLKKAILRPLAKVRLEVDAEGAITPVLLRMDPGDPPMAVAEVLRVDDRLAEVWYDVRTKVGDVLTLRLEREGLRMELHTVETEEPERWRGWSEGTP
jgi:hypothetical protein